METLLSWYTSGGAFMLPLLLVTLAGLGVLAERAAYMTKRLRVNARPFMEHVLTLSRARRFDEALGACADHQALLPDVGLVILRSREAPSDDLQEVAGAALKSFLPLLRRRLGWLLALAVIGLLLGVAAAVQHGFAPIGAAALSAIPLVGGYAILDHQARVATAHAEEFSARLINAIAGRPEVRLGHRDS